MWTCRPVDHDVSLAVVFSASQPNNCREGNVLTLTAPNNTQTHIKQGEVLVLTPFCCSFTCKPLFSMFVTAHFKKRRSCNFAPNICVCQISTYQDPSNFAKCHRDRSNLKHDQDILCPALSIAPSRHANPVLSILKEFSWPDFFTRHIPAPLEQID